MNCLWVLRSWFEDGFYMMSPDFHTVNQPSVHTIHSIPYIRYHSYDVVGFSLIRNILPKMRNHTIKPQNILKMEIKQRPLIQHER